MKTKLKPYRGKLSAEQIVDGMNAAIRNARRLADDAQTMLDLLRYPSALALAILSIEESGKVAILRGIATAPDEQTLRSKWKDYRNHQRKNVTWIWPGLIEKGARDLDSLAVALDPNAEHPALLDQIKQLRLYTDCLGNVNWNEPEKEINKEFAFRIVATANLMATRKVVTLKEIELWIEHIKPVSGGSYEDMKEALYNWYQAMKKEGLYKEGKISVEDFIRGIQKKTT